MEGEFMPSVVRRVHPNVVLERRVKIKWLILDLAPMTVLLPLAYWAESSRWASLFLCLSIGSASRLSSELVLLSLRNLSHYIKAPITCVHVLVEVTPRFFQLVSAALSACMIWYVFEADSPTSMTIMLGGILLVGWRAIDWVSRITSVYFMIQRMSSTSFQHHLGTAWHHAQALYLLIKAYEGSSDCDTDLFLDILGHDWVLESARVMRQVVLSLRPLDVRLLAQDLLSYRQQIISSLYRRQEVIDKEAMIRAREMLLEANHDVLLRSLRYSYDMVQYFGTISDSTRHLYRGVRMVLIWMTIGMILLVLIVLPISKDVHFAWFSVLVSSLIVTVNLYVGAVVTAIVHALVFTFITNPYDIGDEIRIGETLLYVHSMSIFQTEFIDYRGITVTISNTALAIGPPIVNSTRTSLCERRVIVPTDGIADLHRRVYSELKKRNLWNISVVSSSLDFSGTAAHIKMSADGGDGLPEKQVLMDCVAAALQPIHPLIKPLQLP